jgi:hypothetical protein
VKTEEALRVLERALPNWPEIESELGTRRDAAYLRVTNNAAPDRWAVVSSPGDRWFSLEIDGGFSLEYFEEDLPDEDVQRLLSRYASLAVVYLRDGATARRSRLFRVPSLVVRTGDGDVVLRRSVAAEVKRLLTFGRAR